MVQGGLAMDGEKITDEDWKIKAGVVKVGKRRFLRIVFWSVGELY